uniref:small monomeric GTPase n=1 Tax=Scleropages formosus TaxID=113540 RepID=A0A8C9VNW4_SCLFO
ERRKEVTYRCCKLVDKEAIHWETLDIVCGLMASLESATKWGDGFLITYSVTDRCSFESVPCLKRMVDNVKQLRPLAGIPAVTAANKRDVENGQVVRIEEGQALASWSDLREHFYFHEPLVGLDWTAVDTAITHVVQEVRLEFHKHLLTIEKRSHVLLIRKVLKSKLSHRKTMQW